MADKRITNSLDQLSGTKKASSMAVLSCIAYSGCSIFMVLGNKTIISTYDFKYPMLVCAIQNCVALCALLLANQGGAVQLESFQMSVAKKWMPVTVIFTTMLLTSFMSLGLLSVPMVTLFKNVTNIFIAIGDYHMFGSTISWATTGSLGMMLVGAVMSAWFDLMFDAAGYFWMAANCCATAAYVLALRKVVDTIKLSRFGMVYYNNLLSIPSLFLLAVAGNEIEGAMASPAFSDPSFWTLMVISGSLGVGLNLASLWCVKATSPTTYAIVGSLNKIPLTVAGILLFNVPVSWQSVIFISCGLGGGIVYSYAKVLETEAKKKAAAIEEAAQAELNAKASGGASAENAA